jgi:NAD(P)-dependent dehydrogenase (short-subunit alcohol dehydrogenase family)
LHGERLLGRDGPASLEAFRRVVDINVCGTFNIVRLAAESMAKGEATQPDGERGVIVMTSSIAAFDGQIGQAAYAASKGAVAAMTLPLARELGRFGIRVVSIAPGVFETPMMHSASEKVRQPLLEDSVFPKRFGYPEEFAATVQQIFENPMLNGTVLRLDAGLRM